MKFIYNSRGSDLNEGLSVLRGQGPDCTVPLVLQQREAAAREKTTALSRLTQQLSGRNSSETRLQCVKDFTQRV